MPIVNPNRRRYRGSAFKTLPPMANMHITPRFSSYRGVQICVGSFNELPYNPTYSGVSCPFIIKFNKFPLWLPIYNFIFSGDFKKITVNSLISSKSLNLFYNEKVLSHRVMNNIVYGNKRESATKHYSLLNSSIMKPGYGNFTYKRPNNPKHINFKLKQVVHMRKHRRDFQLLFQMRLRDKRLSKFFKKMILRRSGVRDFLNFNELNVTNTLLRIGVAFLLKDCTSIVEMDLVYVNGVVCSNPWDTLTKYDRFQIAIDVEIYLFMREKFSDALSRYYKVWDLHARLSRIKKLAFKMQSTTEHL